MESLEEEHSEIRLSAFQLADELFQRSHFFRQLLTVDFQRLVTLGNLVVQTPTTHTNTRVLLMNAVMLFTPSLWG